MAHFSTSRHRPGPSAVTWLGAWLIAALAVTSVPAAVDGPALDAAFQALWQLEAGQSLQPFQPIEVAVDAAREDAAARADLEARLVNVLQGDATDMAKDYACRQLAIVGSDSCVPALAALLPHARLAHMARYALEGLRSPASAAALREMLGQTQGRAQVGVVISLGRLADADAAVPIAALLAQDSVELQEAAVVALGRIGTVPAAEALQKFAAEPPETLRGAVLDAQLAAVESLCAQGQHAAAVAICEALAASDAPATRAAALRGLIVAKPGEAVDLIVAGLAADEPWRQAVAADCVRQLPDQEELGALVAAMPGLPPAGKIAALASLTGRGAPQVRAAALQALQDADAAVQLAALEALVAAGTAEDVATLTALAATAESIPVRDAACETLRLMSAAGTDQALLALLTPEVAERPLLIRCAFARRSPVFVPAFLEAAAATDPATRLAALLALETMAGPADVEKLVALLSQTAPGEERDAADRAVWMACQQIADPAARTAAMRAALERADAAGKCALLPTLARLGGPEALEAVHAAMRSADQSVRDAGYRALSNWPDDTVAEELLEIARHDADDAHRVWALRAYARVITLPSDRPPQTTYELLCSAMDLATRQEDRELFVARLAAVRVPDALTRLQGYLADSALRQAAVPAIFTLAKGLSQSHPDQARAALEQILPLTEDDATRQQIPKVLRDIEARQQPQQ